VVGREEGREGLRKGNSKGGIMGRRIERMESIWKEGRGRDHRGRKGRE
jgi:hypothetical protein